MHVDAEAIVNGPLKGTGCYRQDPGQDLVDQAISRLITTENLEKIAIDKELLLDAHPDRHKRIVLEKLKTDLSFTSHRRKGGDQGAQEIFISYRDTNAARSRAVVGAFLDLVSINTLNSETKGEARSLDFLNRQIDRSGDLLRKVADELARFKSENSRFEQDQGESNQGEPVLATPEIEDKFRELSRNRDKHRAQHEDFLNRRDIRRFVIEDGPRYRTPLFTIVEHPRTQPDPMKPNRQLLFLITFIGACALGIATAIFLHFVKPPRS